MSLTNYILVLQWFKNVIENRVNNEILLIVFDLNYDEKSETMQKLEEKIKIDTKRYNYKSIDISKVESFNHMTNNTIVIGHPFMDVDKIFNLEHKILFTNYNNILENDLYLNRLDTLHTIDNFKLDKFETFENEKYYDNYIEVANPMKIIFCNDYVIITKNIFSKFIQDSFIIFKNMDILQSNRVVPYIIWKKQIENDISTLLKYKILTSRLAIAIYKSCTLRLYDSNKKIGLYYYNKFGTKSRLTHIPKSNPPKKVKAYILNNI